MGIYLHSITGTEFNELPSTGAMRIKTLEDGSSWARIHWLNVLTDASYFTSEIEANECIKTNRFSALGAIDKLASSQVTLTNLAFEINGTNNFASSSNAASNKGEGWRKYSNASLQLTGTTAAETTLQSATACIPLINGNKYYVRFEIKQSAKVGTAQIYLGGTTAGSITEPSFFSGKVVSAANKWTTVSGLTTRTFPTGNHKFRLDFDNSGTSGTMCFDGLVIIDLTKCFGAGYEPTQAWCDANIPYFQGEITLDASSAGYKKYELMLTYPNLSSTLYNRWIQKGSPNESAPGGYERITTAWTAHAGPLKKASGSAYYNCDNAGSTTWFAAIGQTSAWTSTQPIPGADGNPQTETELWIRIDNLSPKQKAQIFDGNSIIGNEIYEF